MTKLLGLLAIIFGLIVAVAASADLVKLVGAVVALCGPPWATITPCNGGKKQFTCSW